MPTPISERQVPASTEVEWANQPWIKICAAYLKLGDREVAEVILPENCVDGSYEVQIKDVQSNMVATVVKVATWILSLGILPLLAFIINSVVRCVYKFHWVEPGQPLPPPGPTGPPPSATPEQRIANEIRAYFPRITNQATLRQFLPEIEARLRQLGESRRSELESELALMAQSFQNASASARDELITEIRTLNSMQRVDLLPFGERMSELSALLALEIQSSVERSEGLETALPLLNAQTSLNRLIRIRDAIVVRDEQDAEYEAAAAVDAINAAYADVAASINPEPRAPNPEQPAPQITPEQVRELRAMALANLARLDIPD